MDGIFVHGLNISSGPIKLLDDINIEVGSGQVYALLGTDRLKSVLLRIIGGGHSGRSVYIENENVVADIPVAEDICYIVTSENPWGWMTVLEYCKYSLSALALSKHSLEKLNKSLALTCLDKKTGERLDSLTAVELKLLEVAVLLTKGMSRLIINADDILYTLRQYNELSAALTKLKQENISVLIALRDARMVDAGVVDSLGVLKDGKIVLSGEPETVRNLVKKTCYTVKPTGKIKELAEKIRSLSNAYEVKISGEKLHIYTDDEKLPTDIVKALADSDGGLTSMTSRVPSLAESLNKIKAK